MYLVTTKTSEFHDRIRNVFNSYYNNKPTSQGGMLRPGLCRTLYKVFVCVPKGILYCTKETVMQTLHSGNWYREVELEWCLRGYSIACT